MTDAEITLEPEGLEAATEALLKYERWTYGPTDLTAGSLHSTKAAIAIRAYLSRSTLPREGQPTLDQERAFRAAEKANEQFGQWMPEPWLHLFIKAYGADQ